MKIDEKLIYDLIFSDEDKYVINIGDYITNIYEYDVFIDEVKRILKLSKVKIVSNSIDVDNESVIWKIKVKK